MPDQWILAKISMLAKIFAFEYYNSFYSCHWCTLNDSISEMRLALCILARRLAPSALVPNLQLEHVQIIFASLWITFENFNCHGLLLNHWRKMLKWMAFRLSVQLYLSNISFFFNTSAGLNFYMCTITVYRLEPKYLTKDSVLTMRTT